MTFICWFVRKSEILSQWVECIANGPEDQGSILGRVIPKTLKMVLDISMLNTQQYKVRIKGKVELSREKSSSLGVVAIENEALGSPSTVVANFLLFTMCAACQRSDFSQQNFC